MWLKLEKLLKQEIEKIPRPYGIFLSGGIDSGLLAALSKPDFAITITFPEYSEVKYAESIADHLNIPLSIIRCSSNKNVLKGAIKIIGKPINSVSIVPWYYLMNSCQNQTMINGEGADELFGGYSRYLILKHIFELYKKPELKNYHPTLDFLFNGNHSKLVEKELTETRDIEEVMRLEYKHTLPDVIYMEKKIAGYFNVDFRQPFMSPKIKKFADSLPLKYKIRGDMTKWILRKLAKKYLPKDVVDRKTKQGLIAPINKLMGWTGERGEFDKKKYLKYQNKILK